MNFNLNFSLNTWVKELVIEAKSEEEAKQKLLNMSIEDLMGDDTLVQDSEFSATDIDVTLVEYSAKIRAYNIIYDLSDLDGSQVKKYVEEILPKEKVITLEYILPGADIEQLLIDELSFITDRDVLSVDYEIIERM